MNDLEMFQMEVSQMEVLMPSEEEKNRAVAMILDTALIQKGGIWQELCRTMNAVGLRMLFFGAGDCIFLVGLVLCVCLFPAAAVLANMVRIAPCLFLVSPAFYALAQLLTMWKDYQTRMLGWKQTWRVSFRVVMALQMLVLGVVSVVGSVLVCVVLWSLSRQAVSFVWLLAVAFSALFLYGGSSLLCQRLWGVRAALSVPFVWVAVGLVLVFWEPASVWLMQIPASVFLVVAAAGVGFYFVQMYYFIANKSLGAVAE